MEKTHTTGTTTSTLGLATVHTASEAHGIGADTTALGTETHGIGTHGHTHHGIIGDGTTLGITDTADGMTHGIMAMADTMEDGTEVGTTHITDTCTLTTQDGTADGIHIGATTITTWAR